MRHTGPSQKFKFRTVAYVNAPHKPDAWSLMQDVAAGRLEAA